MDKKLEQFVARLWYLGGAVTSRASVDFSSVPVNIEAFLLEATLEARKDVRVGQCVDHWTRRYGPIVSPSRLRKIIQSGDTDFDPASLGALIDIISNLKSCHQNFKIIRPFIQRNKKRESFYSHLPAPKKWDSTYLGYGYQKIPYSENMGKFLKNPNFVVRNCPEIGYRLMGLPPLIADIKVWVEKRPGVSKYRIAKDGYYDVARVVKEVNRLHSTIHFPIRLGDPILTD